MFCEHEVLNHSNLLSVLLWEAQLPFGVWYFAERRGLSKERKKWEVMSREKFCLHRVQTVPIFTALLCWCHSFQCTPCSGKTPTAHVVLPASDALIHLWAPLLALTSLSAFLSCSFLQVLFTNAVMWKPVVFVQVWNDSSLQKDVSRVNDQKLPTDLRWKDKLKKHKKLLWNLIAGLFDWRKKQTWIFFPLFPVRS